MRLAEGPVRSELADHPERMGELLSDLDPARAQRAMQAMLQMQKIDIKVQEHAANG